MSEGQDIQDWVIGGGRAEAVRCEAPVEVPGWSERPWVKLRCLTYEEELRRQAVGYYEEVVEREEGLRVRERCDYWALAEFDLRHCVIDFCLPVQGREGQVEARRFSAVEAEANVQLLKRLPPALAAWLQEQMAWVNRRRPEDMQALEGAKKV